MNKHYIFIMFIALMIAAVALFSGCSCGNDGHDKEGSDDDDSLDDDDATDDDDNDAADDDDDDDDDTGSAVITEVTPKQAENFYAVKITILGENFPNTIQSILFDDTELIDPEFITAGSITATVPSGISAGVKDLSITFGDGTVELKEAYTVEDSYFSFYFVSGSLEDDKGNPLSDINVLSYNTIFNGWTDSDGLYTLLVPPGVTDLFVYNLDLGGNPLVPVNDRMVLEGEEFQADAQFDFVLPIIWLNGTITGTVNAPLEGVMVGLSKHPDGISRGTIWTDAAGQYAMPLYPDDYNVIVSPPSELHLGFAPWYDTGLSFSSDETLNVELQVGNQLSGTILDRDGAALTNLYVAPHMGLETMVAMGWTKPDVAGYYSVQLPQEDYRIWLRDWQNDNPQLPSCGSLKLGDYAISGDLELSYQFDYFDVDFQISFNGNPFPYDVEIGIVQDNDFPYVHWFSTPDGQIVLPLFAGEYHVIIWAPTRQGPARTVFTQIQIDQDIVLAQELDPGFIIEGKVTDEDGSVVPDMIICADPVVCPLPDHACSDDDTCVGVDHLGRYTLVLSQGDYNLSVYRFEPTPSDMVQGEYYRISNVSVLDDMLLDIELPIRTLTGTVLKGGDPVNNWRILVMSQRGHYADTFTGSQGEFELILPEGEYSFIFHAPDPFTSRPVGTKDILIEESATVLVNVPVD